MSNFFDTRTQRERTYRITLAPIYRTGRPSQETAALFDTPRFFAPPLSNRGGRTAAAGFCRKGSDLLNNRQNDRAAFGFVEQITAELITHRLLEVGPLASPLPIAGGSKRLAADLARPHQKLL